MEARTCCIVVLLLQMVCLVSATSRALAANDDVGVNHPGPGPLPKDASLASNIGSHFSSSQGPKQSQNEEGGERRGAHQRGMVGIGSSPPSCEHKCYGCSPCEAIQVPTNSRKAQDQAQAQAQAHLSIDYANYEPERWKCKCGPFFYSP